VGPGEIDELAKAFADSVADLPTVPA
jgi:hypothetical protein